MNYESFRSAFHILNALNWSRPDGEFKEGVARKGKLILSGPKAVDTMMNLAEMVAKSNVDLADLTNIRHAIQHYVETKLENEESLCRTFLDFELIAFAPSNDYCPAQALLLSKESKTLFWKIYQKS